MLGMLEGVFWVPVLILPKRKDFNTRSMRCLLVPDELQAGTVSISDQEAHHALKVLRLQVGDQVKLCDGRGRWAEAKVTETSRHELQCEVHEVVHEQAPDASKLSVLVAAPKGSRFEDMVRSLTELGVGAIRVLITERSQRHVKLDRARRVAGEALKQCGRSYLPEIGPVVEFSTLTVDPDRHILLDPEGTVSTPGPVRDQELIIGPEGGLSPQEREHLISQGVKAVCLAPHILRIETAAVAAAAVWIADWESQQRDR